MNINLSYDFSVGQAPAGFTATLTAVAQFLDTLFINPITINIQVGYGEIAGQTMGTGALGESETYFANYSYSQLRTALVANAKSADQISAVNTLPATDPTNGGNYWVSTADAKALALPPASTPVDGYVGFASMYGFTYNNSNGVAAGTYDFYGVAMHEFTEVLGRELFVGTDGIGANAYTPLDLFHYSANGVHDFVGTTAGYFSLDGGKTDLDNFNTNAGGDFGDWAGSAGHDSFLAFSNSGVVNAVSQADLREMNVLGYNEAAADATPPALVLDKPLVVGIGRTVTISSSILAFSDPDNTDAQLTYTVVTGPADGTLLKSGTAVSTFTQADIDNGLISYHETASSVAADSFTFNVSDPAGNHTATQTFQFQIAPVTVIESAGATKLTQVGSNFYLDSSTGAGPLLKLSGAPVTAGEFGNWAPIGAEQTAGGYLIAWKVTGADQYSVWSTDSSGNYITNVIGVVSGTSTTLETYENSFQQDLNGDGVIGPPVTAVIEQTGSTWLTEVASRFYLYNSSGVGPELTLGGTPVVAGQFGGWAPIGAVQTAGGYEVAWKVTGADQYSVWSTDSNGNYTGNLIGAVSGASFALEAFEPTFQQDLNGDKQIGPPGKTVVENAGSTWLTQVGNQFYLYNSSGAGPELTLSGSPVLAGEFGNWTPIGAEQTAGGYEIAWKVSGADQYSVWSTDGSGNYITNVIGTVSGASTTFEAFEPIFHQDLNGDGLIGVPGHSGASLNLVLSDQDLATPNVISFASGAGGSANDIAPPSASQVVASADFYGDGSTEILWLGPNSTPELSEVSGGSVLGTASLPAPSSSWHLVGSADLDGNGKSDILWQNTDGAVSIWDVARNGTIATAVPGNPGAAWQLTGASDVNGDGKADLLFVNSAASEQQVWLMDGPQVAAVHTFAAGSASNAPAAPLSSAAVLSEVDDYLADPGGGGTGRSSDGGAIALLTPDQHGRSIGAFAGS